ncbi:MAG: hypothetical protein J7497_06285 [Chitinophagaceae bacterium]|nr:hypothetical protein [Chitinophagaceae bacterium]
MQLIEVTDDSLARQFIDVNVIMNRNDPNYIRPLDKDINEIFDRKKIRPSAMQRSPDGS